MLRQRDIVSNVWMGIDDNKDNNNNNSTQLAYNPMELRKMEQIPERAPSQRPLVERNTNIQDDIWLETNQELENEELKDENKYRKNNKKILQVI